MPQKTKLYFISILKTLQKSSLLWNIHSNFLTNEKKPTSSVKTNNKKLKDSFKKSRRQFKENINDKNAIHIYIELEVSSKEKSLNSYKDIVKSHIAENHSLSMYNIVYFTYKNHEIN